MTTIVTRTTVGSNTGKGSPLTHTEVDTNFVNLNTAKLETAAIPLGTLQAPSISFLNDSDTGIFCPQGGNSLAIVTGGQYAITCSSTQAVGIKTANPQGALQVAGSTRIGANDATDAFLEIGEGATGNRNSYIDIVADTTYTDYGLRIIRNNTGANATSELKHRGTGALNFTTQEAAPIVFNTTNSPRLTITSGGLVGIGTSSPSANLHSAINSSSTSISTSPPSVFLQNLNATSGAINSLGFANSGGFGSAAIYIAQTQTGNSGDNLYLTTKTSGGSWNTGVVIDTLNQVGIGVTSPSELLHVNGNALVEDRLLLQRLQSSDNLSVLTFSDTLSGSKGNNLSLGNPGGFDLLFHTGGVEKARIDSSGRLLVGTTTTATTDNNANSPNIQLEGASGDASRMLIRCNGGTTAGNSGFLYIARSRGTTANSKDVVAANDALGGIIFEGTDGTHDRRAAAITSEVDGTPGANDMPGRLVFSTTADGASSPTPRMTIDSTGDLTMADLRYIYVNGNGDAARGGLVCTNTSNNTTGTVVTFKGWDGSTTGTITTRVNVTAYNTSSDYRLKENIIDLVDATSRVKLLKPKRFNFTANPEETLDGFLAHEAQLAVPEAVSGQKDQVDGEGNPVHQGVDLGKFVPLLTAALQEAIGRIESLEAEVAALKAQ